MSVFQETLPFDTQAKHLDSYAVDYDDNDELSFNSQERGFSDEKTNPKNNFIAALAGSTQEINSV